VKIATFIVGTFKNQFIFTCSMFTELPSFSEMQSDDYSIICGSNIINLIIEHANMLKRLSNL